jgi:hypothetical protein
MEYVNCFGSMVRNVAICTREIKSRNVVAKEAFSQHKSPFHYEIGLTFKEEIKCYFVA